MPRAVARSFSKWWQSSAMPVSDTDSSFNS